jgi:CheY-like chemotaxis protein
MPQQKTPAALDASGEIFLVDDSPRNISLLTEILRRAGFRVRAANAGRTALSMIRAELPELVMLDIMMPEMDGYEVCRELKAGAATRDIPVIFISSLDESLDRVKAFQAGGVDYVTKPFQVEEVVIRVESQLRLSRLQRETETKNVELQKAYEQLRTAEEQIARLSQPAAGQLEATPAWAAAMAGEVARAIGAREIGVWLLEGDEVTPLAAGGTVAPGASRPRGGGVEFTAPDGFVVEVVAGITGVPCGALVIDAPAFAWGQTQRRLLAGLAHHLGTALELRSLRRQLTAAEANRVKTRRALHERGMETLLLCPLCGRCFPDAPGTDDASEAGTCSRDGAMLDASRILPFRINGRYRFEMLIGEGGMGTVFSAHDETLERDVALKIIKPQHLSNPSMRLRLAREAKLVARIQHPGVTALFDSGELEDGSAFLVMELLRGQSLSGLLSEFGPGTPRQVARLLRQTSAALAAAHKAEVIHRDIKPDNIFLVAGADGFQAKLLDFGVALSTRLDARVTQAGTVIGTPAYMPPEQVRDEDLDERADVYSLACVIWEALVGRRLIRGKQFTEVLLNLMCEPMEPLSHFLPSVSPDADALFEAALSKSRLGRPKDVEAWAASLAAVLESQESGPARGWPEQGWTVSAPSATENTQVPTIRSVRSAGSA